MTGLTRSARQLRCVISSWAELRRLGVAVRTVTPFTGRANRLHGLRRWAARLVAAVTVAATLLFVRVQVASAATGPWLAKGTPHHPIAEAGSSQTPAALAWIALKDSRGISVWNYEMSIDRGGITSPLKSFWSACVDEIWGLYRAMVVVALWFLDWVLSFNWLSVVAAPMLRTGDAMQSVISRVGAVPALLTIAALASVLWWMRGRWATGIWELGMALVIAALSSGVFAQPVHLLAGDNGLVMRSEQTGLQLSSLLNTGNASSAAGPGSETDSPAGPAAGGLGSVEDLRAQMTGSLVDTFIRQPTEMVNFGRVLEGTKCEPAYNTVIKAGPYGSDSDIRDKVGDCSKAVGDIASNPSASMATSALLLIPAAAAILLLAVVLAGSVIAAACYALYLGVKAIIMLVLGLVPGGTRGGLFLTFAEAAVSLLIIVFTSVFLGVFLQVIQQLFSAGGAAGDAPAKTFLIVDILLVVGVVIFWRQRRRLRESSRRLAEWMGQRPGKRREVTATRLPERSGMGLGAAAGLALGTASQVAMIRSRRALTRRPAGITYNIGDARTQTVGIFGLWPEGGPGGPVPAGSGPGGPAGSGQGGSGPGAVGAHAVLAAATGGASAAVSGTMTKAITASTSARRARLLSRMGTAAAGTGPERSRPIPAQGRPSSPVVLGARGAEGVPTRPGNAHPGTGTPPPTRTRSASTRPVRPPRPASASATGPSRLRATSGGQGRYVKFVKDGQVLWVRQGGDSSDSTATPGS